MTEITIEGINDAIVYVGWVEERNPTEEQNPTRVSCLNTSLVSHKRNNVLSKP